ncbi:hypothetical protein [Nocardia cyriacigeorgica]|uniref:hypothetical protein n=1 Tax=Nocardia cyriacigeorgica TaxID=135487 RepID=UPI0003181901|nr:hypothetical protein [Nocardia cyriacigeorgica]TLF58475.1 hypothetical protein FEK31_10790 [Nocardia cyriacigeorgica]
MTDDERRAKATELKVAGWSYYDIAAQLGYADASEAFRAVSDALASRPVSREAVIVRQLYIVADMVKVLTPLVAAGNRKAKANMTRLRKHVARLDLDAGREYARRHGIALPPEVEELNG